MKKYLFLFSFPCLIFPLSSCTTEYTAEKCEKLSMKSFKGVPRASYLFKENCQNFKIQYTHKVCQKALEKLIITGTLESLEKEFGPDVLNCLTENDIRNFKKN